MISNSIDEFKTEYQKSCVATSSSKTTALASPSSLIEHQASALNSSSRYRDEKMLLKKASINCSDMSRKATHNHINNILDEVSVLIDGEASSVSTIEPTPINPQGVQVVRSLPIEKSAGYLSEMESDFFAHVHDFISLMKPSYSSNNKRKLYDEEDDEDDEIRCCVMKNDDCSNSANKRLRTGEGSSASSTSSTTSSRQQYEPKERFRAYQAEQWYERFQDLICFKEEHGHCYVPNVYPANPTLSQWVKRQRYQYKLKHEQGRHSTLTDEREEILEELGFVWESHSAAWMDRWIELAEFKQEHGHSNVPINCPSNRQLSIWVKCQRRQFKLFKAGQKSNMSPERIERLISLDFVFNPRKLD